LLRSQRERTDVGACCQSQLPARTESQNSASGQASSAPTRNQILKTLEGGRKGFGQLGRGNHYGGDHKTTPDLIRQRGQLNEFVYVRPHQLFELRSPRLEIGNILRAGKQSRYRRSTLVYKSIEHARCTLEMQFHR